MEDENHLTLAATLAGHGDWVTSIATPVDPSANFIISGSRDKTAMMWTILGTQQEFGRCRRSFKGHGFFVQDITISKNGQYLLTGSWDSTLRLWEIATGECTKKFIGHTKDVLSVAFSPDDRQIVSVSRDHTIRVWNTIGTEKKRMEDPSNSWVTCVRFSPVAEKPTMVSTSFAKLVNVWDMTSFELKNNHIGHMNSVNAVAISPDGTLCASGSKDGAVMLWDLIQEKHLYALDASCVVYALAFSPTRYWLCAATSEFVRVWDLQTKCIVDDLTPMVTSANSAVIPECISLAWSANGNFLFTGYTDSLIRVWKLPSQMHATTALATVQ